MNRLHTHICANPECKTKDKKWKCHRPLGPCFIPTIEFCYRCWKELGLSVQEGA